MTERWADRAACATTPKNTFFPEAGDWAAAKRICDTCPVQTECLRQHLGEKHGMFGGTTPDQRAVLRGDPSERPEPGADCGTTPAVWRHRRNREKLCDPCAATWADYKRDAYRRSKNAACGTWDGLLAHRQRNQAPCDMCAPLVTEGTLAERRRHALIMSGELLPPTADETCGRSPGVKRHRLRGEAACDECADYVAECNRRRDGR